MLDVFAEIRSDLAVVEDQLRLAVQSEEEVVTESALYLLSAGGKRLRPAFCLLCSRFADYSLARVLPLAVALELIHMATLVHDDIVDASYLRRGRPTVKARWGNRISTHIGDFLLARSLVLISQYEGTLIPEVLADTSVKMCEGEIFQIDTSFVLEQSIRDYFFRIKRKTALLIAASCQLGAVACGANADIHLPLRRYGHYIGMAFQITDDILDLVAEQRELGKPIGSDLRQGIITLPVIKALSTSPRRDRLREIILKKGEKTDDLIYEAIAIIKEADGIGYAQSICERYIAKAKQVLTLLPDKPVRTTLARIADYIVKRRY